MRIDYATFDECSRFASAAAREQSAITDTKNTQWFKVIDDFGEIVSVAGVIRKSDNGFRLKGAFTPKAHRGKGYGLALIEMWINYARSNFAPYIEAFTVRPDWYLRNGFEEYGAKPNGARVVRKFI